MIYIIRHGQTLWNIKKIKQGRKDSPLTLNAVSQSLKIANTLKDDITDIKDFKIVVSPQWRCQQYASFICEHLGVDFSDCILEDRLREHSFGLWEGKTESEIESEFPGFLEKRYKPENYWSYIVPMGESYELVSQRVSEVLKDNEDMPVIYVCHEMVSKAMRGLLLGMSPAETLKLNHPQDKVYKITSSRMSTLG